MYIVLFIYGDIYTVMEYKPTICICFFGVVLERGSAADLPPNLWPFK